MIKLAPSLLSADFSNLGSEIRKAETGGADWIHIDIMDGHFVPNLTIGPPVIESLRRVTALPFDVHLMIEEPERYIEEFAKAGADIITVHQEASCHLHRIVQNIKGFGIKAGVSINPATPVGLLEDILEELDLVLVMSVNPGFSGQRFIPRSLDKIRQLDGMKREYRLKYLIEVDGGINLENAVEVIRAGADVLVAGSAVYGVPPVEQRIREFRELFKQESLI